MQEERDVNAASGPCTRYIMSDSSPQHGRDYLVTVVCAVRHADFEELRVLSSRLLHFWSSSSLGKADLLGCGEDEVGAILRDEVACMERVRSLLRQHGDCKLIVVPLAVVLNTKGGPAPAATALRETVPAGPPHERGPWRRGRGFVQRLGTVVELQTQRCKAELQLFRRVVVGWEARAIGSICPRP